MMTYYRSTNFGYRPRYSKPVVPTIEKVLRKALTNKKILELADEDITMFNFHTLTNSQWYALLKKYYNNEYVFEQFKEYYIGLESKPYTRDFLRSYSKLFNDFDVSEFEGNILSAKETLWIISDIYRKKSTLKVKMETLGWIQNQLFMEVIDGSSKTTHVVNKNLETLEALIEVNANNK